MVFAGATGITDDQRCEAHWRALKSPGTRYQESVTKLVLVHDARQ